ncbi:class I SAM-dependent methyltransferase [Aliarcobacter cryaerophilus]|uniref:class I SAM-dependent methyltransferase n=1 Tax=Aliarcobacter cryaerophilus TaxID=28198 RepID=UPI0021B6B035|nr:class I SAM-dependent methyltransferase [Aliarcobacter cryaerophilus]MCT7528307.1 class I SAM-dependent methyltransferase [Aliarcobacter cryaerophilus]
MIEEIIKLSEEKFEQLFKSGEQFGISDELLKKLNESQKKDLLRGEFFSLLFKKMGYESADSLWNYKKSIDREWFDHRLHILYPEKWFADHWTMSANNVLPVLTPESKILNLCSGDGFYDYHFYSKRAKKIDCVEVDKEAINHAKIHHQHEKINYIHSSVFDFTPKDEYYDVVLIRGAIEHFYENQQNQIFGLVKKALKPNGYFIGDAPKKMPGVLQHKDHHCEWEDENEMKIKLSKYFNKIETSSFKSYGDAKIGGARTTLFWKCTK